MAGPVPFLSAGHLSSLQSRVTRSKGVPVKVPFMPQCPPSYRGYSTAAMEKAYEAAVMGTMSVRKAAEEYGVPRSTLHEKVTGKVVLQARSGSKTYLTNEEEASLLDFLIGCASIGYAKSRKDVLAIAQQIVHTRKPDVEITKGWWDSFRRRHPEVSLRQAEPLSYARAAANNPNVIKKYFELLAETIEANGLTQRPGQIFNCDETGMPLVHKPPRVVAHTNQKHPYAVTSGDTSQITVLACASASGYTIPPMVVFDRKQLQAEMSVGEIPGTFYGLSENGWMDATMFESWFAHHFLVHVPSIHPLLLLLDGHASHYNPTFLKMAAEEGIIVFCLPPHTTHLLQPLDNGAFASLKDHWRSECQRFYAQNPGKVITRRNFVQVFQKAWVQGMSISNVTSCFRAAGVFPVDKTVVLSQLDASSTTSPSHTTGMPYVPFCTPRKGGPSQPAPASTDQAQAITFSPGEVEGFQTLLKESTDSRYRLWLETFYPTNPKPHGVLATILQRPTPPAQRKAPQHSQSACVLTSEQCIQEMVAKEEKKKEKQEEKERRKAECERKRQAKAVESAAKKAKREAKKQGTTYSSNIA